jgi:arylsulfatase A-like enzyme
MAERARMEIDLEGAFIDLGIPAQVKHTRGGWWTSWKMAGPTRTDPSRAQVRSSRAPLWFYLARSGARDAAVRARSALGETELTMLLDGRERGEVILGPKWQTIRFSLPGKGLSAGRHKVTFVFSGPTKGGVRAEVDWVWFGRGRFAEPPPTELAPVRLGGLVRRAFSAPTPRTLAFYLHVPEQSFLVFDYGSPKRARVAVRISTDRDGTEEVFSADTRPGRWTEAQVDLSDYAGRPVRLELCVSQSSGPIYWGEPEIMSPARPEPSSAASRPAGPKPKNVILVVIDTARADAFSAFNPRSRVKTPAHDELASHSTIFSRAYNSENWTNPSVASILTGLYPSSHGAQRQDDALSSDQELLSERLKSAGFETGAFIANGFCSEPFGFKQGWDFFRNYIRNRSPHEAEDVFADALQWIEKNKDEPFFAYIQTIDPHVPYAVDRKYWQIYHPRTYRGNLGSFITGKELAAASERGEATSRADRRWIRGLYHGEITYHDEHMGRFIDKLRSSNLLEDTLLVVTNDHGEELGEHGRYGHGHTLYEELLRAPLLFHYPPLFAEGREIDTIVEAVDIAPTILETLGLAPSPVMEGRSLLGLARGGSFRPPSYAVSEFLEYKRSIRIGDLKLMVSSGRWQRFFDLGADPGEKNDLIGRRPIAHRLCEVYLSEALAVPKKAKRLSGETGTDRRRKKTKAKVDPELKKKLEAVGYF